MSARRLPLIAALSAAAALVGLVGTEGVASAAVPGSVTTKQCKDGGGKVTGTTCTGGTQNKKTVSDATGLHGNPGWWPTIPTNPRPKP